MQTVRIKQLIKQHETYGNFARRAGIAPGTLQEFFGGADPKLSTVQKMCDALRAYHPEPEKLFLR